MIKFADTFCGEIQETLQVATSFLLDYNHPGIPTNISHLSSFEFREALDHTGPSSSSFGSVMHKLRFQRYQSLRISYAKSFKMLQATSTHWSYLNLPVSDESLFLLAINPECLVTKAWTSVIPASSMFQIAPLISLDAKWGTW